MKGVIIAAGYGTRFLPCTKTIPKEMFPLVDTPAIQLIVDEFINSGIKDILIVTSRRKKSLEDYFDREVELETVFKSENDTKKFGLIDIRRDINIYFTRQFEMKGTGDAILKAKSFVGNSPFVIAYPDDIVFSEIPLAKQLINVYEKTGNSVLALEEINGDLSRYGVAEIEKKDCCINVKRLVEKPKKGEEPGNTISVGRYLFTPELFSLLEEDYKNFNGKEFYHINAINRLGKEKKLSGCLYKGERIDVGDKLGYIEGIIKYSLLRNDLKDGVIEILKKYLNSN